MSDDALYEGLDEATPPDPVQAALAKIETAEVIALQDLEPIDFDVDSILPADDAPALMFGPPASLKSWLALALCDSIVRGRPFLGFKTRQRPSALFLNLDAGAKTFRNRVRSASDAPGLDVLSLTTSEFSFTVLRALLERYAGGFVAIDCLSSIYAPDMKKDPAHAMRSFVDDMRAAYALHGCGGVIIDHPHRPKERGELGDYHGSVQKEAAFRTMWSVSAIPVEDDDTGPRQVKIACRKLSEGQPFRTIDVEVEFGHRVTVRRAQAIDPAIRTTAIEQRILDWGRIQIDAFSKRTVEERVRGSRAVEVRKALDSLIDSGRVIPTGAKRGNGHLYRVADSGGASASGTHSDTPDAPWSAAQPESASASPISIGDALSGTHSGTHSEDAV